MDEGQRGGLAVGLLIMIALGILEAHKLDISPWLGTSTSTKW